jgi:long-chain acyl-CoA synthetase
MVSTTGGDRPALPDGQVGVVLGRGPQIMKGYYKNPEATARVIDRYGWFDTGDLGRINPATGDLILTGRAKDTIVLTNGENIEPTPIEDAILSAPQGNPSLIEQVMITGGEEGRKLIAIAVLNPTELANGGYFDDPGVGKKYQKSNEALNDPKCSDDDRDVHTKILRDASQKLRKDDPNNNLLKALRDTVKSATSGSNNFRSWEVVNEVYFTLEPFAMCNGQLTQSYKVKRDAVYERYKNELPS